jgi:hypothetical protein
LYACALMMEKRTSPKKARSTTQRMVEPTEPMKEYTNAEMKVFSEGSDDGKEDGSDGRADGPDEGVDEG